MAPRVDRAAAPIRDRIVELRRVRAGDLAPNPRNWRRHPEAQRKAMTAMLADVGYSGAALARRLEDGSLELIDGHLRASLDPEAEVPVLVLDLDEAEALRLLATFDPMGAMAVTDQEALGALLSEVAIPSGDLLDALRGRAGTARHRGLANPDEVPDLTGEPETQVGDLWICGAHRLVCADAGGAGLLEALLEGRLVDLLFTDPPYGVSYVGRTDERLTIVNDDLLGPALAALLVSVLGAALARMAPGASFYICSPGGPAYQLTFLEAIRDAGLEARQEVIWVKDKMVLNRSDFHWRHERLLLGHAGEAPAVWDPDPASDWCWEHEALVYGWARGTHEWEGDRKQTTVWSIARPDLRDASALHPTVKPVELIARALALSSRDGSVVLDPFAGSGSTMIAAQQLDRVSFGVELDPVYCERAVRRWEGFTGLVAERIPGAFA